MSSRTKIIPAIALTSAVLLAALAAPSDERGDAVAGRTAFEKRCTGRHALDHDNCGPRLTGLVARKAGAISPFPNSEAAKKSGVVWDQAVLDKWLTDLIPETDIAFRLDNPVERAAIIAFLQLTGK